MMSLKTEALSRRSLLRVLGTGIAGSLLTACGSVSSVPTTPPAAPAPAAVVPAPTPITQPTAPPTVAPAPVAQTNPTATPASRRVRLATWFIGSTEGSANSSSVALRAISQKLPPERAMTLDLVLVDTKSANGPPTASTLGQNYAANLATGAVEADLIFADHLALRALGKAKVLRDLGPILDKESWFKKDDFWTNILQAGQIRGVQLGLPMDAAVDILAYNSTNLKRQGIDLPTSWTWDQLITTAKKLTSDGKWGFRTSAWSPSVFTLAWQHGAQISGSDGKIRVTEPGTIQALEFLQRLLDSEHISPPLDPSDPLAALNDPFSEAWETEAGFPPQVIALNRGLVAMLAGLSTIPNQKLWWRQAGFSGYSVDVTSLPSGDHPAAYGAVFSILGIPTKAPNPDLSLAALHDLLDATDLAQAMPPRKTVKNLRQIDANMTEKDGAVLGSSLATAHFLPGDVTYDVLQHVARELVLPVLTGKKKPQDAANDAQKLIDAEMNG